MKSTQSYVQHNHRHKMLPQAKKHGKQLVSNILQNLKDL